MSTKNFQNSDLHELLHMGEALILNGAEISRVEDTMVRMGKAFGAQTVHAFVITSNIIVTILYPDGQEVTQTRRISDLHSVNFTALEELNRLSRRYCQAPFSAEELHREICSITEWESPGWRFFLGGVLAAAGFTMFFGGTLTEAVISVIPALAACYCQRKIAPLLKNTIMFDFLLSFLLGVLFHLLVLGVPGIQKANILSGVLMLMIPGIAITNSARDILLGDTISGILHMVEAILWAGALAMGFVLAAQLMRVF